MRSQVSKCRHVRWTKGWQVLLGVGLALLCSSVALATGQRFYGGPVLHAADLKPYLKRIDLVTEEEYTNLPVIVGNADDYLIATTGHAIYVRGLHDQSVQHYGIYDLLDPVYDPHRHKKIGYVMLHVGSAEPVHIGDLSTLMITRVSRSIRVGYRLLPEHEEPPLPNKIVPHTPGISIDGQILYVVGGTLVLGSHQVVILSVGAEEHVKVGDVLDIQRVDYKDGSRVLRVRGKQPAVTTPLVGHPSVQIGLVLVYHTMPHASLGLVIRARAPIHVYDRVTAGGTVLDHA